MQQARSGVPASTQLTQAIAALRRLRSNGKSAAEQCQDQVAINVVISKLLRNSAGLSSVGHVDDDTGLDTGRCTSADSNKTWVAFALARQLARRSGLTDHDINNEFNPAGANRRQINALSGLEGSDGVLLRKARHTRPRVPGHIFSNEFVKSLDRMIIRISGRFVDATLLLKSMKYTRADQEKKCSGKCRQEKASEHETEESRSNWQEEARAEQRFAQSRIAVKRQGVVA